MFPVPNPPLERGRASMRPCAGLTACRCFVRVALCIERALQTKLWLRFCGATVEMAHFGANGCLPWTKCAWRPFGVASKRQSRNRSRTLPFSGRQLSTRIAQLIHQLMVFNQLLLKQAISKAAWSARMLTTTSDRTQRELSFGPSHANIKEPSLFIDCRFAALDCVPMGQAIFLNAGQIDHREFKALTRVACCSE